MKPFNLMLGMSKRRIGLAIARGIGLATIFMSMPSYSLTCSHPNNANSSEEVYLSTMIWGGTHLAAGVSMCAINPWYFIVVRHVDNQSILVPMRASSSELGLAKTRNIDVGDYARMAIEQMSSNTSCPTTFPSNPSGNAPYFSGNVYCAYLETGTHLVTLKFAVNNNTTDIVPFESDYYPLDSEPVITSNSTISVSENQTSVLSVIATDPDGNTITYSISGGADSSSFNIDPSSGVLTFNTAPDYETKNNYTVEVTASDGSLPTTQTITVTITDVHEGPVTAPPLTNNPATSLTGDTEVISWTTSPGATNYQIQAGSSAGRNDYHDSGTLDSTATSEPVVNLPTDGSNIFITVWYKDVEGWKSDSYEFTAFDDGGAGGSSTPPTVSSHANGANLTSTTETFTWSDDVSADNYWLQIGSSAGRNDHYDSGQLENNVLSQTVSDLPGDGTSLIHVRIWYKSNGRWEHITDTSYKAATVAGSGTPTPPTMTSPSTSTSLTTATQTFAWSADSATKYWLQIGSSAGRNDVYDSSELAAATDDASGLPTDGSPIFVRVWAFSDGQWEREDFTYNDVSE